MNLASLLDPHPDDAVAVISRGEKTTYGQLRTQVASFRGGLARLGLEPGDRVGLLCANNWYFVVSYLATLGAGLVAVPLNPSSPRREIERELAAIGARALVVGPSARDAFAAVDRGTTPALEYVIGPAGAGVGESASFDQLLDADPVPVVDRDADDLAVLMFTSGTAGSPKAAMLTHGNLLANLEQVQASPGRAQEADDVSFGVIPLFHIFGLNVVLGGSIHAGGSVLLVERFDPSSALEAIQRHGVTLVSGPPTMWSALADQPDADAAAMASVRLATSGAAKLPDEVARRVQERFGLRLTEGYGLTESSPVVATANGLPDAPMGSIGRPVVDVAMRLVDPDGEDVLIGDEGEIWVKGPNVFHGYWNDPEATAAALTPDGWLRTGDLAVVNDDGYLFLVDRAKDLIIVSGFNVYPAEVEEVLLEHPAIEGAAVVGVPHPHSGEAVKAFVVTADGFAVEEDDVIAWCAEQLARYKCPSKVMFVDELPHNVNGKVLRRSLR
ncbi:MAG: long-chain fatty acid--CoA ligase [Acidimicrobiales bacterium]|nr:long-chain fatty acid--CoA ligase [Acidimicrobiales bacterium]MCB9372493.1 long-chain fatty acid--CoA ligase [Microthrixaceae bacterium]